MNIMQSMTTEEVLAQAADKAAKKAANTFMLVELTIPRKTMRFTIPGGADPSGLRSRIAASIAEAGEEPQGVDFILDMFGPTFSKDFKNFVLAPRAAIRTYAYKYSLTFAEDSGGQRRGPRLVPVTKIPEFITNLKRLEADALDSFETFMSRQGPDSYSVYCEAGRKHANRKFPNFNVGEEMAKRFPSEEDFREAFVINIGAPKALPYTDIDKFNLPASLAVEIAAENEAEIRGKLEGARSEAVEAALKLVKRVATQLDTGERLAPSLITDASAVADTLKTMAEGYDYNLELLNAASVIKDKIASVGSTESWKDNPAKKAESLRAAKDMSKLLSTFGEPSPPASPVQPKADLASSISQLVTGGMMDELL
jgi:hypothetical protein